MVLNLDLAITNLHRDKLEVNTFGFVRDQTVSDIRYSSGASIASLTV